MTIVSGSGGTETSVDAGQSRGRSVTDARARVLEYAPDHTLDEVLQKTIDEAESLSGSTIGFYDLVDPDQASFTLQTWSARTQADSSSAEGKGMHYAIEDAGVWADSIRQRVPVVHNDLRSLPGRKWLPDGHADLIRELVVPVVRGGLVRAVLGVGNKQTDYDQADVDAVGQLADLTWDIAEDKMMQDKLRLSCERFRTVADNAYDWETWTAPDGTLLYVSPSCERITGHAAAEFMADPGLMMRIAYESDRPTVAEHLRAGAEERSAEDLEMEFRIVTPGGAVRWIDHWCTPVYGEDGACLGRRCSNRDITQRRRTENRLAHERHLLDQVEAVAHVGSWRIGLGKRELSEEAARILGCDPKLLDGDVVEAVRGVIHPDDRALFEGPRVRALLAEGITSTDFRIIRPDGRVRWIAAQGTVEMGDDAEPVAVNGILQDVTQRKVLEERRASRLEQDANTDRLTGLLNVRGFDLVAERAIAQAGRAKHGVGLLFCDIDGLKTVNDELGHLEGDRVLCDAAEVLRSTLRNADAIARVGGDEFIVLAVSDGVEDVAHLRERLLTGFDLFDASNERPYRLEVSCGAASCEPGVPCRLDELRAAADAEMYAEKSRRGRIR